MLFVTALCGLTTTFGATILGPVLSKPDLSGYVREDELRACRTRLDEREKTGDEAIDRERERTSGCLDKLTACASQNGAQGVVIESMQVKKRR